MKYTVGCDIVEVERIKKASLNSGFCRRAFSADENLRFSEMKYPYMSMAGAWAAKEAFGKALGTGISGFSLNEITIEHDEKGAPFYTFSGNALKAAEGLTFSLSISHTKQYAQAVCIACRKDGF